MIICKEYNSISRIAGIITTEIDENDIRTGHEYLIIEDDDAFFSSDNYQLVLSEDNRCALQKLNNGDVITINEKGIINILYDSTSRDATIYLTALCNSNCIMCPSFDTERRTENAMPDEWLFEYIRLLPADVNHIVITGGEPTLRTELFFDVLYGIADKFPTTETLILTNGRSFASKQIVRSFLDHCPAFTTIAIPIHHYDPSAHDSITRAPGSFAQTHMGIDHLLAEKVAVEIRIVVSKLNCEHLAQIADLIIRDFKSVSVVNFIGLETRGNCAINFNSLFVPFDLVFAFIKPAIVKLVKAGIDVGLYNFPLCWVDEGFRGICRKSITPSKIRYNPECDNCELKSACGGFFGTTRALAKPTVKPIYYEGES